jgi:5'-nucleotidase
MRILLTNDDGYFTEAYQILGMELQKEHDVTLMSPEQNCSGISHAFTLRDPVFFTKIDDHKNPLGLENFYSFAGTPVDCVKFCLLELMAENPPDLVIAGLNPGANMGCDLLYSGTVAAAMEASLNGCSGIAISYDSLTIPSPRVQDVVEWFMGFLTKIEPYLRSGTRLININYPDRSKEDLQGHRFCTVGKHGYTDSYIHRISPHGKDYYWLTGEMCFEGEADASDKTALHHGCIAISPLKIDFSDSGQIMELQAQLSL